jgi:hypothetical protein
MMTKFLYPVGFVTDACRYLKGGVSANGQTRLSAPEFIGGDEERLLQVAGCSKSNFPYSSITLSSNDDLAKVGKKWVRKITRRFVRRLTGNIHPSRFAWVAYLHERKGGFDVHIIIAKDDLWTHRPLPLWSATKGEIEDLNIARRLTNLVMNLGDPDDPWRKRYLSRIPKCLKPQTKHEFRTMDLEVTELAGEGIVRNQADIVEHFQRKNFKIKEINNEYITVINERGEHLKFAGEKYGVNFDLTKIARDRREPAGRVPDAVDREIEELRPKLAERERARFNKFARLFGTASLGADNPLHRKLARAFGVTRSPGGGRIIEEAHPAAPAALALGHGDNSRIAADGADGNSQPLGAVEGAHSSGGTAGVTGKPCSVTKTAEGHPTAAGECERTAVGPELGAGGSSGGPDLHRGGPALVAAAVDLARDPILPVLGRPDDLPGGRPDPGAPVQVTHPATTTADETGTENEYHTDPLDHEQFTRIRRRRSGLAAALLRGIGAALSAALGAVRAAIEACERIGALGVDSERVAAANLGAAREMSRCAEELSDEARVGDLVREAEHRLEPTSANCGRARSSLEGLRLSAEVPDICPEFEAQPLDFSPKMEPTIGFEL